MHHQLSVANAWKTMTVWPKLLKSTKAPRCRMV
jgi:hypothetical protein